MKLLVFKYLFLNFKFYITPNRVRHHARLWLVKLMHSCTSKYTLRDKCLQKNKICNPMSQNFLVFIYFIAFWKWWPKKKEFFWFLIQFSSYDLLKFSPLGGDLPCDHSFFDHRPMEICLYLYKYSTQMHKNLFLGVLKGKESKSAVKIAEKQHFHWENRGWKFCNKIFLDPNFDLKLRAVDATLQTIFFPNFVALCLYFLWI